MVIVRKAKLNDFDAIFDLRKQLWKAELPFDTNLKKDYYETEEAKKELLKAIRARKNIFLVAEENQKILGIVDGCMDSNCKYYNEKVGYLDHLCVDKNHRKQGIGKLLMDAFVEKMKEQGAKFIKINAFRKNEPAVSLYEKEGYQEYSVYYTKKI